ncbi:hypothetical protein BH11PLA1_BH11PLA1_12430 [soil metagenome]
MTVPILLVLLSAGCAAPSMAPPPPDDHPASTNAAAAPMAERSRTLDIPASDPVKPPASPRNGPGITPQAGHEPGEPASAPEVQSDAALYTCPMHPEVVSKEPGRCPECRMKLVPQQKEGGQQ